VVGERTTSSVPTQALYLMNNPFVRTQSEAAAKRLLTGELIDNTTRIEHAYRRTLGRNPTSAEREILIRFLEQEKDGAKAWGTILHSLYGSLDFRFLN